MNTIADESDPADALIKAVKDVGIAVRDGTAAVTQALREIDETLALIASRNLKDDETLPSAGELLERVASLGARAVNKAVLDWEKRSGITSD